MGKGRMVYANATDAVGFIESRGCGVLVGGLGLMSLFRVGRSHRRGASMMELAFMLPVMTTLVLGSMEVSRGVRVDHVLEEAARAGCRVAIMEGATVNDVNNVVKHATDKAKLSGFSVQVHPTNLDSLGAFEPVRVTVSMPFSKASWTGVDYMAKISMTGSCVMPKEIEAEDEVEPPGPGGKKNKKNKSNKSKKDKKAKKAKKSDAGKKAKKNKK
jgi:hypothetical protein